MVEEHSTSLTSRIDPEYPTSVPTPVLSPSCQKPDLHLSTDATATATTIENKPDSIATSQPANAEQVETLCDLDIKSSVDHKKDNFKASRPNSIESKRSKSLGNTSSVDSSEDSKNKKDVKKTKSNPVKIEAANQEIDKTEGEIKEGNMTAEESVSPSRNVSSEAKSSERSESPKPGCSSQQDLGKHNFEITVIYSIFPYTKTFNFFK